MSAHAVKSAEEFRAAPPEYREAVRKIVRSHAINELYGARVFDEPAIALAPNPYHKWLACRIAMEEYGHHVQFRRLGEQLDIPGDAMLPDGNRTLSIFEFPLASWEEFCVTKMIGDLAEILQVEDLLACSFLPLRNLARRIMPEEIFHASFGADACAELVKTEAGRSAVQEAVDRFFPFIPPFFGRAGSRNNESFRRFGIKRRKNEEMRADYIARAGAIVGKLGLELPALPAEAS
jgi:ring-1,2-phenylacetyl-CoA epoxidase subunit PaaA